MPWPPSRRRLALGAATLLCLLVGTAGAVPGGAHAEPQVIAPDPDRAGARVAVADPDSKSNSPQARRKARKRKTERRRAARKTREERLPSGGGAAAGAIPPSTGAPGEDPAAEGGGGGPGGLTENGLGSPFCKKAPDGRAIGSGAQRNCRSSGTVFAPVPLGNYGIDIHIDDGGAALGPRALKVMQQLFVTLPWTLFVGLTQAVLVLLEWAFSLSLLTGRNQGGIGSALASGQRVFSQPWLAASLAIAAITLMYQGVFRRRTTDAIGQTASMILLIVLAFVVVLNPSGTVGRFAKLVDGASLASVSALTTGNPSYAAKDFSDGTSLVFRSTISGPWCYLEFGDVGWCRKPPSRAMREAYQNALTETYGKQSLLGKGVECATGFITGGPLGIGKCNPADRGGRKARSTIRRPRSHGELFLAFPANSGARNSIKQGLLRELCGSEDDNDCAPSGNGRRAAWRTEDGTWKRIVGMGLILVGGIGMIALFGAMALKLVWAQLTALLYLFLMLVAIPVAAFGEAGQNVLRSNALKLFGAIVTKLVYAVMLGIVILVLGVLDSMAVGWLAQWTLIAAFWWGVFAKRDEVMEFVGMSNQDMGRRGMRLLTGALIADRLGRATVGRARTRARERGEVAEEGRYAAEREAALRELDDTERGELEQARAGADPERAREGADAEVALARDALREREGELGELDEANEAEVAGYLNAEHDALADQEAYLRDRLHAVDGEIGDWDARMAGGRGGPSPDRYQAAQLERESLQRELGEVQDRLRHGQRALGEHGRAFSDGDAERARKYLDDQAEIEAGTRSDQDYRRLAPLVGATGRELDTGSEERASQIKERIDGKLRERSARNESLRAGATAQESALDEVRREARRQVRDVEVKAERLDDEIDSFNRQARRRQAQTHWDRRRPRTRPGRRR